MKIIFRTFLLVIGVAFCMMIFNSCGSSGKNFSEKIRTKITEFLVQNFSKTKDERLADASMKNIKKCVDEKNVEAFKQLFSRNVIKSEENLCQQIQDLFDLLPNGIVEYNQANNGGVSDGWESGYEYYEIMCSFTVSDGAREYILIFTECIRDTANKDRIGIESILFYEAESEALFDSWYYSDNYTGNRTGVIVYQVN